VTELRPVPKADPVVRGVRTVVSAITHTSAWRWASHRVMPPVERDRKPHWRARSVQPFRLHLVREL